MKKIKQFIAIFGFATMVLSMASVCYAKEISIKDAYVDSNTYQPACVGVKDITTATADLTIENIYEPNGVTANYMRIKAKIELDGTVTIAEKGVRTTLAIPTRCQSAGSKMGQSQILCKVHFGCE